MSELENLKGSTENCEGTGSIKKRFSIRVLGVGGAGCNAVQYLARQAFEDVTFTVLNTDARTLARSAVENKILLGAKSSGGLGVGGDPERGLAAAEENRLQLSALCEGADVVFVVAGLGGGTGTGASPLIARLAKDKGALVLGIVFLPFDFEGKKRQDKAHTGWRELQKVADGVICLPNQKIFKLIDEKTSVLEAFDICNELVAQGLRGIWRLLTQPGLINVDFADLCALTREKHTENALAIAEGQGENRAREVAEKLMAHPLMENGQVLAEAASLLVSIVGGPDLTMLEINRVMDEVHRHAEQANIVMGAAIEEDWRDRMAVTLLASRHLSSPEPVAAAAEGARLHTESASPQPAGEADTELVQPESTARPSSRFAAQPPSPSQETTEQLLTQAGGRPRKSASRLRQGQLPLEIISKGRFEKSQPTIHQGQDLDVPTYIRRGVALN